MVGLHVAISLSNQICFWGQKIPVITRLQRRKRGHRRRTLSLSFSLIIRRIIREHQKFDSVREQASKHRIFALNQYKVYFFALLQIMNNAPYNNNGVINQWDIGQTAFHSADLLRGMIRALSADNVQAQAVQAAESLGFGIVVSPKRIDEAVVALGGNESLRLSTLKVLIGLNAGGIVRTTRSSTALKQFFLLMTASKLCFSESELGTLAFEMISKSGFLAKFPVAAVQLTQLIHTLSGHAEKIVPADLMHEVASEVDEYAVNTLLYHRI